MKTAASPLTNPFPGLRPFRSDEHHLFFGREEQTGALLQLLRTNRFLAVVGTSGGESSLVRAGMIAELYGGTMTQAGSTWEVMILRPGGSPIENLARAFVEADLYDRDDPSTLPRLLATLNRSLFGLVEAMKQCELFEPGTNLLVVVDQFEELFRFRQQGIDSEETAAAFVNLLLTAGQQSECPIYVTITMRSDYLGDCSEIPGLAEAVNDGEYLIPRLLRDQKRDAIEKPIGVGGARISPMLVQRLLNDVGDDPDQLPVLQHALMRMWDAWSAGDDRDRPIDFADFEATGGLAAALSNHADEIYDSLPSDRHRSTCEKIFKSLTEKGDDNRGIRRPSRLARLRAIAESDRDEVGTILDAYRGPGVTFLMPGFEVQLTDRTVIDLSHESLMRGWQRLRMWVEDEAQSARIFRRLLDTARLWKDGKAGLFRDPDLQIALSWREQEAPNTEWAEQYGGHFESAIGFLETSNAEAKAEERAREAARERELEQARRLAEAQQLRLDQQQRATRRLRAMIAGLAAVAVIAGVAFVAALLANHRAVTLAVTARQNEERARQNEDTARQNARKAEESRQETAQALALVASQKREVEGSLSKAESAERSARAAEEAGRKLLYTTDMRLAPFVWRDDRSTAEQLRVLLAKHVPESTPAADKDLVASSRKSDLRGFEWHYYQHLLQSSADVFSGHDAAVVAGAFNSDDSLVTLDQNGQLRRWDLDSQAEDPAGRRDLPGGRTAQVRALSPDGRLAALAEDNKVRVFDTATGDVKFAVDSPNAASRRLIFSRDGDRLVIVDDKMRWFSASSGEPIASVDRRFDRVESLALSADGLTLAVVGHGTTGHLVSTFRLDTAAKAVTRPARDVDGDGTLYASALTSDGGRIAFGTKLSGNLMISDATTGRLIRVNGSAHASPLKAMAYSGDGARLVTADAEGTIKVWADPERPNATSTALLTIKGHQGAINAVAFSGDGKQLLTVSADKTARIWDLDNAGAAIRSLQQDRRSNANVVRYSPDGQLIAVAGGRSVRLWEAATGRTVRVLPPARKGYISSVAFSPSDHRLLAVGYGREADVSHVTLWDIDAGTELARLPGATDLPNYRVDADNGPVGALAFSPDGKYLAAGFGSRNMLMGGSFATPLKVWEVATRRLIRRLNGHTNYCVSLDFSWDGQLMASGSRDGTAVLWSTATWKPTRTLQNPEIDSSTYGGRGMVECVAFSPDCKTLALASREGSVQLWDIATGKLLEALKGHSSAVLAVAFSPDGRTLASGGTDQTVRLWNVETRRELMQLDPGGVRLGQLASLAFSPDGKQLLAGGSGAAVWSTTPIVWNEPERAAEQLRRLLHSNADFPGRIRMLSENLSLHEALARLDARDRRVQAALAATQANWHASREAWPEAVAAFDRLVAADPSGAGAWLRTPGLLRVATALLHQNRPRDGAALLTGGAGRRTADGIPPAVDRASIGITTAIADGQIQVTELLPGSPASRSGLLPGDVILKVNDTDSVGDYAEFLGLLAGEAGTKVRLTVRHPESHKPEVIELIRERFLADPATRELLYPLRTLVEERLARAPRDAGLLELRAELAGQWSDMKAQVADYTSAIDALTQKNSDAVAADLRRLYASRGNAYAALRQWQAASDDYSRAVTNTTTDDTLLSNQALAHASLLLEREETAAWRVLSPTEMKSRGGATLTRLDDGSILAGGTNPEKDTYTLTAQTDLSRFGAIRLEAMPHESLGKGGPGRSPWGNFALSDISLKVQPLAHGAEPIAVKLTDPRADFEQVGYPVADSLDGKPGTAWSIDPERGRNHEAVYRIDSFPQAGFKGGMKLAFTLDFQFNEKHALGHFRLSVGEATASTPDRVRRLLAAKDATDPWQKLAALYRLKDDQQALDRLVERRPKLAGPVGDLFTRGKDEEKDWRRAIALYNKGITEKTIDVDLLSKRALAHEALKSWDAASADWSRAVAGNPDGARLLGEFARRLAAAGQRPLAKAQFDRSEALFERALREDPENDIVAAELAQLLFDREEEEGRTRWTILEPSELKSKGGATLSKLPDDSILASGKNPLGDAYTIIAPSRVSRVGAIRLEALTHESLPDQGPGRSEERARGNFAMIRFTTTAHVPGEQPRPIDVSEVAADHHFLELTPNHWNTGGGASRPHAAVYLTRQPVDCKDGTRLEFQMEFFASAEWPLQNLGRFRLSVASDPAAFEAARTRFAAMKLTDPWARLAVAYAVNGLNEEASRYFSRAILRADDHAARQAIVELAARFDEVLSTLVQRHPDDPQWQLAWARNLAERGKRRLAEKQPAKAQAELEKAREIFTRLRDEPRWPVPTTTGMESEVGARMELQKDGSVFVHLGELARNDTYTLRLSSPMKGIKGLRLEALADPRLPNGGPGWKARYGNFVLSEVTLEAAPGSRPDQRRRIALRNATADFSETNLGVSQAIDGNSTTGWAINPELNKDHTALFDLAEEVGDGQGARLTVRLHHQWQVPGFNLGRFRVSFTNDATKLHATRIRLHLKDSEIADLNVALASAHLQQGHKNEAIAAFAEALPLAVDRAGKARIIAEAAPVAGALEKLAERATGDATFQAELARHYAERGNTPLADAARTKARVSFEEKLAREPENSTWAAGLADLVLPPIDAKTPLTVPTSENQAVNWRFTTTRPHADWTSEAFDDSAWKTGLGSFGSGQAQGLVLRTEWKTSDIWLRRKFEWKPDSSVQSLLARVIYDDVFELFINGQQVLGRSDFKTNYDFYPVDARTLGLLKPGTNTMAVHCYSTIGGQYIDVGLLGLSSDPRGTLQRLVASRIADPWARLAAGYHLAGDRASLDRLLERRPTAARGIGDLYAATRDWKRAIAEYDRAINGGSKDSRVFAARAEAHEKLEHWELAASDLGNADLHAVDKSERSGDPPMFYLERRAWIWSRLGQLDKKLRDCNELLKPEKLGDNPWIFKLRGETYDALRRWQKARADYDRAIQVCLPTERVHFQLARARHFAAQGRWKQATDDLKMVYERPADFHHGGWPRTDWWSLRDAASIFAIAGDVENYDRAAAECYRQLSARPPNPEESRCTIIMMLLFPELITDANRPRLLELAGKTDAYLRPRLTAAIHFRSGDHKKAAELFDSNGGGPEFFFLAAMAHHKLGNRDRARQLLEQGQSWAREQRAKDPWAGVPPANYWQEWACVGTLHYEASELINGPGTGRGRLPERAVGEARYQAALGRHLAERGNAPAAEAALKRACALFAERLAKEPVDDKLAADLLSAYRSASRTREAIPLLTRASEADPKNTMLSLNVAALQAWFGQEKELAATRRRVLASARDTKVVMTAERAAKLCSILPSPDTKEVESALVLARSAVRLGPDGDCWNLMALGMSEYRSGNYDAAEKALRVAAKAAGVAPEYAPLLTGTSSYYRAMSLFRLGKKDEARKLAAETAAKMKPLPADEKNPLAARDVENDLFVWLAYKEAKAMIGFDAAPASPKTPDRK